MVFKKYVKMNDIFLKIVWFKYYLIKRIYCINTAVTNLLVEKMKIKYNIYYRKMKYGENEYLFSVFYSVLTLFPFIKNRDGQ